MPINSTVKVESIDQEYFHKLDRVIMGQAFNIHNKMGRLLDEKIYQSCLTKRALESQLECQREVELKATHSTFTKSFFLDLLVQDGAIYEIKTARTLTNAHQAQLLNYLLLTGVSRGELINFRPSSVESRFVSTSLKTADRHSFNISTEHWQAVSNKCIVFKDLVTELLNDWGSHLHIDLYKEALVELISSNQMPQLTSHL